MMQALTIARRELLCYLLAPSGYIIIAVFMLATALMYFLWGDLWGGGFNQGNPASLRLVFSGGIFVLLFVGPAISMRTLSEEYRMGTIEMLMTTPITEQQVIFGKFLGSFSFLIAMLVPTLLYVVALELYGRPDYGELLCGYLGMVLAGGAFLATGLLFSTMTASQVLAYLVTLFFWLILLLLTKGLPSLAALGDWTGSGEPSALATRVQEWSVAAAKFIGAADPQRAVRDFAVGLIDTYNIVYFLGFIIVPLIMAVIVLRVRRIR